jgi:hypothetical protein
VVPVGHTLLTARAAPLAASSAAATAKTSSSARLPLRTFSLAHHAYSSFLASTLCARHGFVDLTIVLLPPVCLAS